MKSLIRTISVFAVVSLAVGCFALAKDNTVGGRREVERENEEYMVKGRPELESREVERENEEYNRQQQELNRAQHRAKQKEMDLLLVAQEGYFQTLATRSPHGGGGRVLVIPAAEIKAEELLTITEDMSVMSYIFDEKLGQVHMVPAFLGDITFLTRDARGTQGIYLDGYGALFVMKVDFLLSPPAETPQEEKPEEGVDSVWQEAKRKIFEPQKGAQYEPPWVGRRTRRIHKKGRVEVEEKYDAEKVEDLKRKLIRTLKHAANIRNLKPDEQVILSVTGKAESGRVTTKVQVVPESGQIVVVKKSGDRQETRIYGTHEEAHADLSASRMGLYSPTVMTIRAKKADVDAFSKGELDFDKFRQKVQIFTH